MNSDIDEDENNERHSWANERWTQTRDKGKSRKERKRVFFLFFGELREILGMEVEAEVSSEGKSRQALGGRCLFLLPVAPNDHFE